MRIINMFLAALFFALLVVFIIVISIPLITFIAFSRYLKFNSAEVFIKYINNIKVYLLGLVIRFAKNKSLNKNTLTSIIDPRSKSLKELPNGFQIKKEILPESNIIVYYEPYYSEIINKYIQNRKADIINSFSRKDLNFLYFKDGDELSSEETIQIASYYFPQLLFKNKSGDLKEQIEELIKNNIVKELFKDHNLKKPCLIRLKKSENHTFEYSVFYIPEDNETKIEESFGYYLSIIPKPSELRNSIQFRKSNNKVELDHPIEISTEFKEELQKLLFLNGKAHTLKSMLILIEKVSPEKLGFEGKFLSTLNEIHDKIQPKISELIVSPIGNIYLKDYDKGIKLTPLQKTVYLFFLSKPKGIYFKDLPEHKNELLEIYSRVSSRTDLNTLKLSIEELSNPYSNSMSEKCSRIKEAFLKQLDDEWAKYYYISGDRNEKKLIKLDRNLVVFEDSNF